MARYEHDFMGIPGEFHHARGMDPNFDERYHGMRTRGRAGQAPYGTYRWRHRDDLGGSGGFRGRYDWDYTGEYESGYGNALGARSYSRGRLPGGGGGVPRSLYDREYLRDFNAHSPALHGGGGRRGGRYDSGFRGRGGRDAPPRGVHEGYRAGYAERGLSDSGYGQRWLGPGAGPGR